MFELNAYCVLIDDPYEAPTDADITVDITTQTVPEIVHSTWYT